jgi:predicted nucleic acid-binding protein
MPLNIPEGVVCFVDANIFVYTFIQLDTTSVCRAFLARVLRLEVGAVSTANCLADAVHRIMCAEAKDRFGLSGGAVGWLQDHPQRVGELSRFRDAARRLHALPLRLLDADSRTLLDAVELSSKHGLLTNDALIVALMRQHGLSHLVTNDDDFDAVPGLTIWKPR